MHTPSSTKQKLVIASIVALLALIGAIGLYVLVSKKYTAVEALRADVARAKQEDLVTLKRAIRSFEEHAPLLEEVIVSEQDMFSYIDDLKRIGEATGAVVTVQNLTVVDVGNDGKEYPIQTITDAQRSHGVLTLTIRLDGTWNEVMSFLLQAEQLPRQTSIDAVRFASVYNEAGTAQSWAALFELVTSIE